MLRFAGVIFVLLVMHAACDDRDEYFGGGGVDLSCRGTPQDCPGEIGGDCRVDEDCSEGACCHEGNNCGGGMCLYLCGHDADCPAEMLCQHGYCFFRCSSTADCGPGQSCEHGNTICEYT
jgi:hypothetical protein